MVTITDNGSGCCPNFTINGSVYAPNAGSQVVTNSNTAISVNGQVIIGTWTDSSGNHPGSIVNFDSSLTPPIVEVLKLVQ